MAYFQFVWEHHAISQPSCKLCWFCKL